MRMLQPNKVMATATFCILLGLTGVCLFGWMAALNWEDTTGVIVGIIFIVLSVLQIIFSIRWYRVIKQDHQVYHVSPKEMTEVQNGSPRKEDSRVVKGQRESAAPLLKNRESARESAAFSEVEVGVKDVQNESQA